MPLIERRRPDPAIACEVPSGIFVETAFAKVDRVKTDEFVKLLVTAVRLIENGCRSAQAGPFPVPAVLEEIEKRQIVPEVPISQPHYGMGDVILRECLLPDGFAGTRRRLFRASITLAMECIARHNVLGKQI